MGVFGWAMIAGRGRSRLITPPAIVLIPALLVGAAMLLPVVYLLIRGASASEQAWDLLFRMRTLETLARTLLLMGCVTALSALIAVPFAWLTLRSDLPFRRVWTILAALPWSFPASWARSCTYPRWGRRGCCNPRWKSCSACSVCPTCTGCSARQWCLRCCHTRTCFSPCAARLPIWTPLPKRRRADWDTDLGIHSCA